MSTSAILFRFLLSYFKDFENMNIVTCAEQSKQTAWLQVKQQG
jgi:hypothetical protein